MYKRSEHVHGLLNAACLWKGGNVQDKGGVPLQSTANFDS